MLVLNCNHLLSTEKVKLIEIKPSGSYGLSLEIKTIIILPQCLLNGCSLDTNTAHLRSIRTSCTYFFQFIAVARKRSHERRSDKEKTSLKRSKDVTLEKASRKDQDADKIGEREFKTEGDEEGKGVIALLVFRL